MAFTIEDLTAVEAQLATAQFLAGEAQGAADNEFLAAFVAKYPKLAAYLKTVTAVVPAKTEEVNLFDDEEEDEEAEALREKKRLEAIAKRIETHGAKKKVIAKTIIVFNVKVFEEEEDLNALAAKIFEEINQDGLVWNKQFTLVPIAYGMKMLQLGMIVEDDKVQTDDIFERIQEWEDTVQSVDIESMQKL